MMHIEKKKQSIQFSFECEGCGSSWSENLFDLINHCTFEELKKVKAYLEKKLR